MNDEKRFPAVRGVIIGMAWRKTQGFIRQNLPAERFWASHKCFGKYILQHNRQQLQHTGPNVY